MTVTHLGIDQYISTGAASAGVRPLVLFIFTVASPVTEYPGYLIARKHGYGSPETEIGGYEEAWKQTSLGTDRL